MPFDAEDRPPSPPPHTPLDMTSFIASGPDGSLPQSRGGSGPGLSEELCRHERKRSLCLGLREAGPPRSTAACWSATRGLRPWERRSRRGCPARIAASGSERRSPLGNRGAARPPRTPWIGGRCRASRFARRAAARRRGGGGGGRAAGPPRRGAPAADPLGRRPLSGELIDEAVESAAG